MWVEILKNSPHGVFNNLFLVDIVNIEIVYDVFHHEQFLLLSRSGVAARVLRGYAKSRRGAYHSGG